MLTQALTVLATLLLSTGFAVADETALVNYIFSGIDSTPSRVAGWVDKPGEAVATVESETFTVATTYYEPEQTDVVAVLNNGMMALLEEGHSLTLASQQIAVLPSNVVVIGTGAAAATVTPA